MTMIEPFEMQGTWWLPDQKRRVQGTLRFDPKDGISVALSEPLAAGSTDNQTHTSKIIHGVSSDGNKISLLDCIEYITNTHFRNNGIFFNAGLLAKQCVLGAHLTGSTKFNKHKFILHNFLQFFFHTGIHTDQSHEIGYVWDSGKPVVFPIGEDEITVKMVSQPSFLLAEHTASIKEDAIISIDTASPVNNLDEAILGSFQALKAMLEFSLGYPVPIVQFQSVATDTSGKGENIDIFFSQSVYATQKIGIPQQDVLFSMCGKTDNYISDFVRKWYAFYSANRFSIDVIINSGVQSAGVKRPEQSFFFLISSLEALHRSSGRMKKAILRQRLSDVLDVIPKCLPLHVHDKDILVKNFKDYRTLLAHQIGHSEINDNIIFKWHLTLVLWGITVLYVLKLLDFPDESLVDIVKYRRNMLNALNWIGEVSSKPFGPRVKENGS